MSTRPWTHRSLGHQAFTGAEQFTLAKLHSLLLTDHQQSNALLPGHCGTSCSQPSLVGDSPRSRRMSPAERKEHALPNQSLQFSRCLSSQLGYSLAWCLYEWCASSGSTGWPGDRNNVVAKQEKPLDLFSLHHLLEVPCSSCLPGLLAHFEQTASSMEDAMKGGSELFA